jgi:hypothetical protein
MIEVLVVTIVVSLLFAVHHRILWTPQLPRSLFGIIVGYDRQQQATTGRAIWNCRCRRRWWGRWWDRCRRRCTAGSLIEVIHSAPHADNAMSIIIVSSGRPCLSSAFSQRSPDLCVRAIRVTVPDECGNTRGMGCCHGSTTHFAVVIGACR